MATIKNFLNVVKVFFTKKDPKPIRRIVMHEGKGLNPARYFATTFPVADTITEYYPFNPKETGVLGTKIHSDLLVIPGVEGVGVNKWQIRVSKISAYKWREVYPKVVEVLHLLLGDDFKLIEESLISIGIKRLVSHIKSLF